MTDNATRATNPDDYSMVLKPLLDLPKVRHVLVVSGDGMVVAASEDLPRDTAEGIAAMSSAGFSAIQRSTNTALQTDPEKNPIETVTTVTEQGICMIVPAGNNAVLVVAGGKDMAMGVVAGTAARQASKLGHKLMSVPARDSGGTRS